MEDIFNTLEIPEERNEREPKSKKDPYNGNNLSGNEFADFFAFKKFITLSIIKFSFIVGLLINIGIGMYFIVKGSEMRYGGSASIWTGFAIMTLGNVFWRLICEMLILMFRIAKSLANIEKNTKK